MAEETGRIPGPAIIAMKGQPCTGKSKWGRYLARTLQCPIIDQDDVLSSIVNLQHSPPASQVTAPPPKDFSDISFEAVCRAAQSMLKLNFTVIIDSPLSRKAHLDRLLQLSTSSAARLIIVECKPQDPHEWESWLDKPADSGTTTKHPYKPTTWDDLERLLMKLQDNGEESDYDVGEVSTLVVDTTSYFEQYHLDVAVEELLLDSSKCVRHEELPQWIPEKLKLVDYSKDGGIVVAEVEEEVKVYTREDFLQFAYNWRSQNKLMSCAKCQEPISGTIYNCNEFEVLLHKLCAESPQNLVIFPQDYPPYLDTNHPPKYSFPKTGSCPRCKEADLGCPWCLFQTHLKSDLLPTVIHHEGHMHPLLIRVSPMNYCDTFRCLACGDEGEHLYYCCDSCNFKFHVKCVLLPFTIKNKYHSHTLTRKCSPKGQDFDEICNACETKRNTKHWIYNCDSEECDFACHLNCKTLLE